MKEYLHTIMNDKNLLAQQKGNASQKLMQKVNPIGRFYSL